MRRDRAQAGPRGPRAGTPGFTLIELLVVLAIIGLIIALVLVAAADGVRRAEERATQGLIAKLETGLNDRLDALLNSQAPVNQTHRYLAAINFNVSGSSFIPVGSSSSSGSDERRAQVIAQFDYIKSELPDVFFLNASTTDGAALAANYPLNFAAPAYPAGGTSIANYYLPLGNLIPGLPYYDPTSFTLSTNPPQYLASSPTTIFVPPNSGVFGASFSAIGGITKNLGYAPAGYDGIDNNGNGLIDELPEGTPAGMTPGAFATQVGAQLAKHNHKTARAEMLYAILVEGLGPLGSVFNRDEFTAREVQDTDGDGLPEFVDAWGEPLQFFRWPIYFGGVVGASDTQIGSNAYSGYSQVRQLDPLDPNQLLVSPGWWSTAGNPALPTGVNLTPSPAFAPPNGAAAGGQSQAAIAFMHYFHLLVEPNTGAAAGGAWDRTGTFARRAFFSRFLILSAGPDREPGVAQFAKDYQGLTGDPSSSTYTFPNPAQSMDINSQALLFIENQASQTDPTKRTGSFLEVPDASTATTVYLQTNAGLDDITNQNLQTSSSGVR